MQVKSVDGVLVPISDEEIAALRPSAEQAAAQLQVEVVSRTQQRLDDFARTRGYDDIKSLSDYAGDEDAIFNAEGTYGKQMRSRTWRKLYQILGEVLAGTRPMPASYEAIEPELPTLSWPV